MQCPSSPPFLFCFIRDKCGWGEKNEMGLMEWKKGEKASYFSSGFLFSAVKLSGLCSVGVVFLIVEVE